MTVASAAELQADYEKRERYGAAASTVEALMYLLRERGVAALKEPDCQHRLSELNKQQMLEIAVRLQTLKLSPAWSAEQVDALFEAKARL